jgi:uncharacterized membrane-anchored protein YhcB (DUF1043 family)
VETDLTLINKAMTVVYYLVGLVVGFALGKYIADLEHRAAPTGESTTVHGHDLPKDSPGKRSD